MPGPEAAGATTPPPTANTTPPTAAADVIDFQRRALARTNRQDAMTTTPEPPADPIGELYAVEAEALYISQGMTLTSPATAAAHRIALALALNAIDGALDRGYITADAHQRLRGTLLAAQRAPDRL
ncbi:hypothetical protein OG301_38840 (plasmid) [Streptomyces platensis]|uniref:hypothetical protein n=1 Tax=Streptomyces platensis TaxID=58346 RepID=UPI002ED18260|nr:hypothetical protein OG301_38840 [Streptomyces platensis]